MSQAELRSESRQLLPESELTLYYIFSQIMSGIASVLFLKTGLKKFTKTGVKYLRLIDENANFRSRSNVICTKPFFFILLRTLLS